MSTSKILKTMLMFEILVAIPVFYLTWIATLSPNANEISTVGKFDGSYEATDNNGITDTYYQFKANDGSVWWALTESQMGFIPDDNIEYTLTYDNNGTTKANKPCDCCECEVYDDVFLCIKGR
jgi:hypothetical protein